MVEEFLLTQVTYIIVKGLPGEKDLILLIFWSARETSDSSILFCLRTSQTQERI